MPAPVQLTPEQEDTLRRMWADDDYTNDDIAQAVGTGGSTVTRIAHRLGLPSRKEARTDAVADDIIRLHEQGNTPSRIAAKLGGSIGEAAIGTFLARRGIEPHVLRVGKLSPRAPRPCPTCYAAMHRTPSGDYQCEGYGAHVYPAAA